MSQHQRSFLTRNQLLAAVEQNDFDYLWPHLEHVLLPAKQVLYEPNTPIEHVHFVEAGICSMVATADHKPSIEVGMVGREGLVGLAVALGSESAPHQVIIQVAGSALRMTANELRRAVEGRAQLRGLLLRYALVMMAQVAQTAACNGRHRIESRLARWLLIVLDRVDGNEVKLTHKLLGQMLGVRRTGVTIALQALESSGIIEARHGSIEVLDRGRLEGATCDCYSLVEDEFVRQLGGGARIQSAA